MRCYFGFVDKTRENGICVRCVCAFVCLCVAGSNDSERRAFAIASHCVARRNREWRRYDEKLRIRVWNSRASTDAKVAFVRLHKNCNVISIKVCNGVHLEIDFCVFAG